jgi:hypothetical protein
MAHLEMWKTNSPYAWLIDISYVIFATLLGRLELCHEGSTRVEVRDDNMRTSLGSGEKEARTRHEALSPGIATVLRRAAPCPAHRATACAPKDKPATNPGTCHVSDLLIN